MNKDIDQRAVNEAALELYNFEQRTTLEAFETVPLNTVLLYRDRATCAVRAYAFAADRSEQ